jgi:hypothetical protein
MQVILNFPVTFSQFSSAVDRNFMFYGHIETKSTYTRMHKQEQKAHIHACTNAVPNCHSFHLSHPLLPKWGVIGRNVKNEDRLLFHKEITESVCFTI